jgi:predicted aspartyl protease
LDTGAAATTLTPAVAKKVGYSRRDAYKESTVHTAIGEERGYWIHVAEFTVLDVTTPNFALTVFPLAHKDIDGLVGMNFLRHFLCAAAHNRCNAERLVMQSRRCRCARPRNPRRSELHITVT